MTESPKREQFVAASQNKMEADGIFLRRILVGLIAATFISGAVTIALSTQHDLYEQFQLASTQSPA